MECNPPVTRWCNNLSLAGQQPVRIKLPLSQIQYLREVPGFRSAGHKYYDIDYWFTIKFTQQFYYALLFLLLKILTSIHNSVRNKQLVQHPNILITICTKRPPWIEYPPPSFCSSRCTGSINDMVRTQYDWRYSNYYTNVTAKLRQ